MVGRIGISPEWFFHRLSNAEVDDLMHAMGEKEKMHGRQAYEVMRFGSGIIYQSMSGKPLDIDFPWETDEGEPTVMSAEDVAKLKEEINNLNSRL